VPDRVPLDMGGNQTGISRIAYEKLLRYLGKNEEVEIMDLVQQLARPSEDILKRLDIDTRYISAGASDSWEFKIKKEEIRGKPHLSMTDEFGVTWSMPEGHGMYYDITYSPLAKATLKDIENYNWPKGNDPGKFRGLKEKAKSMYEKTDKAIISGITGVVYEICWYMRGFENFYMDLASDVKLAETLLEHTLQFWKEFETEFLNEVGEYLQVICVGDDLAGQGATLFSPETYRKIVKPRQRKLYELIHKKTKAKLWYHSCGAVSELIPDLIEIGVDILNPVQFTAKDMETAKLKREFGKDIVFWGGGCDPQHILSFATPDKVKSEVKKRINDLAPNGGYVFNNVHNIQADVSPENIIAMYEAAKEYGKYPIR